MTTIPPRNPVFGVLRMLAFAWTLLSLLGLVVGVIAIIYAGGWGCVGHSLGWFGCTAGTSVIAFGAAGSLFMALVALFFMHIFYVAGARVEDVERPRRTWRDKVRSTLFDAVIDIFD